MTEQIIQLNTIDLVIAALLVLTAGGVSLLLRLDMEKRLFIASLRTVIQLLLVGYILKYVFQINHSFGVLGISILMIYIASRTGVRRSSRKYDGITSQSFLSLLFCALITTIVVTSVIIGVEPWYKPQYFIPLLGMILGNSLTGISLCLDQFLQDLDLHRDEIEMELAHGASRWEAAQRPLREAIRRGMIPIINTMMVVGIVSLPGMLTGQILQGGDPFEAAKYQIVVMFMIAAASTMGSMGIALLSYRILFNKNHQLEYEKISKWKGE